MNNIPPFVILKNSTKHYVLCIFRNLTLQNVGLQQSCLHFVEHSGQIVSGLQSVFKSINTMKNIMKPTMEHGMLQSATIYFILTVIERFSGISTNHHWYCFTKALKQNVKLCNYFGTNKLQNS